MRKTAAVGLAFLGTLVLLIAFGLGVILTGGYNVAATVEHWDVTSWALNTLKHNSVSARAEAVEGSPPTDEESLRHGLEHFDAMCVQCHGAPGVDRGETGQGMNPLPPDLAEEAEEWSDAELFWITKHGIRLAGMPAFGETHSDEEIWMLVAFMRGLDGMRAEEYAERVEALAPAGDSAAADGSSGMGHTHPPGEGHD